MGPADGHHQPVGINPAHRCAGAREPLVRPHAGVSLCRFRKHLACHQAALRGSDGSGVQFGCHRQSVPVSALAARRPTSTSRPGRTRARVSWPPMSQLFGEASPAAGGSATNSGFITDFAATLKGMDEHRPIIAGTTASDIMGFSPLSCLPVLSGLARGFAVCDHWFSSVPTETFPNRAFLCAATSQGHMDDSTSKYTSQSIFGLLSAHNLAWSIYGYNSPPLTRLNFPDTTDAAESHFGVFRDFQAAAAAGSSCRLYVSGAQLGLLGQQPTPQLRCGPRRATDPRRVLRPAQRACMEPDPADRHL